MDTKDRIKIIKGTRDNGTGAFERLADSAFYSVNSERWTDEAGRQSCQLVLYFEIPSGTKVPVLVAKRDDSFGRAQLWAHVAECTALR